MFKKKRLHSIQVNHLPNYLIGTKNKQIKLVLMIRRKKKGLISLFYITTDQLEFARIIAHSHFFKNEQQALTGNTSCGCWIFAI